MQALDSREDIRQLNLELLANQVVEGFITGLHKSPFHGFSVEFAEHRLYNTGESVKNIDWKLYGKTDKLFVKRYEEETNLRCQLVVDVSSSMYFPSEKNNKLTFSSLAVAAIINLLKRQRDAFGLSLFAETVEVNTPAKSTTAHLKYIFHELTRKMNDISEKKTTSVASALHQIAESVHKRSLVIIFSDMLENIGTSDEIFGALQHLKHNKHEVVIFNVFDKRLELDFEFENRPYLFVDNETGEQLKLHPNEVRETYLQNMGAFKKELNLRCAQYRIDLVDADINKGFYPVLYAYLVKRNRMN